MRIDNDSVLEVESYDFDKTMEEINQLCNEINTLEKTNVKFNINAIEGDEPIIYPESYLNNADRRIILYDNNYQIYLVFCIVLEFIIRVFQMVDSLSFVQK